MKETIPLHFFFLPVEGIFFRVSLFPHIDGWKESLRPHLFIYGAFIIHYRSILGIKPIHGKD